MSLNIQGCANYKMNAKNKNVVKIQQNVFFFQKKLHNCRKDV